MNGATLSRIIFLNQLGYTTRGSRFSSGHDPCRWTSSEPTKEGLRRLSLATTVFTCECSQTDPTAQEIVSSKPPAINRSAIKPLYYPQVLGHICLARTPTLNFSQETTTSVVVAAFQSSQGDPGSQSWGCSGLRLDPSLGEIVERIVRAARLDPATATVQDLDELDGYFACMCCAVQDEHEVDLYDAHAFRWRDAVRHEHIEHAPTLDDVSWQVLTAAQVEEGRQDSGSGDPASKWFCGCCKYLLPALPENPEDTKFHLNSEHQILDPVKDRDYHEDVSSPECGYSPLPVGIPIALMYTIENLRKG